MLTKLWWVGACGPTRRGGECVDLLEDVSVVQICNSEGPSSILFSVGFERRLSRPSFAFCKPVVGCEQIDRQLENHSVNTAANTVHKGSKDKLTRL